VGIVTAVVPAPAEIGQAARAEPHVAPLATIRTIQSMKRLCHRGVVTIVAKGTLY